MIILELQIDKIVVKSTTTRNYSYFKKMSLLNRGILSIFASSYYSLKNISIMRIFTFTFILCLFTISAICADKKVKDPALSAPISLEEVDSKPLTKKALRQEKRMLRFEKWVAKIQQASSEGRVVGAALFAFFLGFLGIHRVYLGGSGLLILGYFFTFGGLFGLLPLIDFIRIVAEGTEHYENNDALFAAFQSFGKTSQ